MGVASGLRVKGLRSYGAHVPGAIPSTSPKNATAPACPSTTTRSPISIPFSVGSRCQGDEVAGVGGLQDVMRGVGLNGPASI